MALFSRYVIPQNRKLEKRRRNCLDTQFTFYPILTFIIIKKMLVIEEKLRHET